VLALTDHDETSGIEEAVSAAREAKIGFVPAAELSVGWDGQTVHVVGLAIDPACEALAQGLAGVREGRAARARRIGAALAEAGIDGAYEGALLHAKSERLIARTHFARFLVDTGRARDMNDVFKRYLGRGKPGYVPHPWPMLAQAVGWIRSAGGHAVLAHPGRYKLDGTQMRALVAQFSDCGGAAIEVLSPSHTGSEPARFASLARAFGLAASCGSDYHGPGESAVDLGDFGDLPLGAAPVWTRW
jgi:predicted metal-dependent phosphoesterase TrpH